MQTNINYKILNRKILILGLLFFIITCSKDEIESIPEPLPIITETTYLLNFLVADAKFKPVLDAYVTAYEYVVNSGQWKYKSNYSLDIFHLLLFSYDNKVNNVDAMYMVVPHNSNYAGDLSDVVQTTPTPTDDTKVIRFRDVELAREIVTKPPQTGSFGSFSKDGENYLFFIIDKYKYGSEMSQFFIQQAVGFYIHEGFHLFPQPDFTKPNAEHRGLRFKLPEDYPADSISFSLIGAGMKLYELIIFEDDPDWSKHLKMLYVIFKKLKELDNSGKNYIDGYYLYYAWVEGVPKFVENHINKEIGLFDNTAFNYSSFEKFQKYIQYNIDSKNTSVIVNGEERVARYFAVAEYTYYHLGASSLFILDNLGEDVITQISSGLNPYQMLQQYIDDKNISIDEASIYKDVKALIDWEATKTMMQDYIELWK